MGEITPHMSTYRVHYIEPRATKITLEQLSELVLNITGVPDYKFFSPTRKREVVFARHIFNYFAWNYTTESLKRIGDYLDGRDHSTIVVSRNACIDLCKFDKPFQMLFNKVEMAIKIKYGDIHKVTRRKW